MIVSKRSRSSLLGRSSGSTCSSIHSVHHSCMHRVIMVIHEVVTSVDTAFYIVCSLLSRSLWVVCVLIDTTGIALGTSTTAAVDLLLQSTDAIYAHCCVCMDMRMSGTCCVPVREWRHEPFFCIFVRQDCLPPFPSLPLSWRQWPLELRVLPVCCNARTWNRQE